MDLSHLNPPQREAVETTEGPLLVLAGAGSGKTRVITHRIARLLDLGVPADEIVALTFTNKAAGEMRERLMHMVGRDAADELVMSTFHSLGVRMLRGAPEDFDLDSSRFSILDQGDVYGVIRGLLREHGHHGAGVDRRFDLGGVVSRISLWKNAFISPEEAREMTHESDYDEVAASVYGPYTDRLHNLGAVDFDDLVCRIAECLATKPEVRAKWQTRFQYLMVDEYQDTNTAQFQMLKNLLDDRENLCVVGDDDQAIYGWRGAKVANILAFDVHFPSAKVIKLEKNYRSRASILDVANASIQHNTARHDKTLIPHKDGGERVVEVVAQVGTEEAMWVGKTIREMVVDEHIPPGEIAVLYRSALQAKSLEEHLQEHGIPYRVLGGQAFYDKKEVKDALAYFKAMVTPRDELAVRRALETPSRGIGRVTMEHLRNHAKSNKKSLMAAIQDADNIPDIQGRARAALGSFAGLIREGQARLRAEGAARTMGHILDQIRLRETIRKDTGSDDATAARWDGVQWLLGSLDRYEDRNGGPKGKVSWQDYFNRQALDSKSDDEEAEPRGQVTLATLHSSKGLEWDNVFILGCEEGIMPHRRVGEKKANDAVAGDLEEERRLFYVGVTRARERLWLTRAAARVDRGREVPRATSRFVEEIPKELLETYEIATKEALTGDDIESMAAAFLATLPEPEPEEPQPGAPNRR